MESIFEPWKRYVIHNEYVLRTEDIHNKAPIVYIGDKKVYIYSGSQLFSAGIWLQSNEGHLRIYSRSRDGEKIIWRSFNGESQEGPVHQHDAIEIGYIVEGNTYQSFSGEEHKFKQGEFWIVDRNCYHSDIYGQESLCTVYIGIPAEVFDSVFVESIGNSEIQQFLFLALLQQKKNRQFLHFTPRGDKSAAVVLMENLVREIIEQKTGYYDISKGLLARLLESLSSEYDFLLTSQERQKMRDLLFRQVEKFIQENYKTATIRELVNRFHYNEDYYNRLIKEYSSYTYSDYLKNVRLKEAEKMLCMTKISIEQIVGQVGYKSRGHFYRLFTERYGMTPAKYRKQNS
ncbi:AraC family transcriptional regulator [Clostridium grantii]|uniref:AraC-type DNA-binding protein n=1 Tax=Clostridium grantii DSM 8605 TaxID=1121316 RepID=A0A1M5UA26_9CLOT|nr:AraC family transcriptional regulator [Clostridium grantii]SHH59761.1 AraC-type DNA-binding protein [Clostridium grantii DSM 8605]